MLDPEDPRGLGHLAAAYLDDVAQDCLIVGKCGVEHIAALAARAGDDEHLDAFADVLRHRGRTLARLVVRVRVHAHETQRLAGDRQVGRQVVSQRNS